MATLAHSDNLVLGGGAVSIMIGCAVIAQVVAYTRHSPRAQVSGLCLLATGLIGLAVAGAVSSLPLLLAANAIAGTGYGLVFLGGITDVNAVAPPDRRADVLSSFYVIVCLGTGVPVTGAGLLATQTGLLHAVQYFAIGVALGCLALIAVLSIRPSLARDGAGAHDDQHDYRNVVHEHAEHSPRPAADRH